MVVIIATTIDTNGRATLHGTEEREVCALEKLGGLAPVTREHRHPDTQLQLKGHAAVVQRTSQSFNDDLGLTSRVSPTDGLEQYHKSIGSDVTYAIRPALMCRETSRDLAQHLVAGCMTERSDDALELLN